MTNGPVQINIYSILHYINNMIYDQFHSTAMQNTISRLMVVGREAKKLHACTSSGLCDHYSELFTQMAALKFESTVT